MSALHIWGGSGTPTGDTLFVSKLADLDQFKTADTVYATGGVYTLTGPVVFTALFTDFLDCRIVLAGGSLHGYAPWLGADTTGQAITASALGAVPFITSAVAMAIDRLSIVGVAIALDLNGSTDPTAFADFDRVAFLSCGSFGSIVAYSLGARFWGVFASGCGQLVLAGLGTAVFTSSAFAGMTGGVVFSGPFLAITINTCQFFPGPGVTALAVTSAPVTSVLTTFDVVTCAFFLDDPTSVGIAVPDNIIMVSEGLDVQRALFQTTAGGPPLGLPFPGAGFLDHMSNQSHLGRCKGTDNSVTDAVGTWTGNGVVTIADGANAVKIAGSMDVRRANKFIVSDNEFEFDGGIAETVDVFARVTVGGASNKEFSLYIATGTKNTIPPVPAAIVDYTIAGGATGVGAKSSQVVVTHRLDFKPGEGGFVQVWMASTDGTDLTALNVWFATGKLPT